MEELPWWQKFNAFYWIRPLRPLYLQSIFWSMPGSQRWHYHVHCSQAWLVAAKLALMTLTNTLWGNKRKENIREEGLGFRTVCSKAAMSLRLHTAEETAVMTLVTPRKAALISQKLCIPGRIWHGIESAIIINWTATER